MAVSRRPSFLKRQKEQQRAARATEKREARRARKAAPKGQIPDFEEQDSSTEMMPETDAASPEHEDA